MGKKYKLALLGIIPAAITAGVLLLSRHHSLIVLNTAGEIGNKERDLMITATLLMLIVVIPVFVLLFYISWHYREGNSKARYSPTWDGNRSLELLWWALPFAIIATLSIITWKSSHELDPHRAIAGPNPVNIQVIALPWKWLFIYPDSRIATVNYLEFPAGQPINFSITSDAPMNSFWIPQLGGQVYAMSGMDMKLHLIADKPGSYRGLSANISGKGFAGMHFEAKAVDKDSYKAWLNTMASSNRNLDIANYNKLSQPSENNQPSYYSRVASNLYDRVVLKYNMPQSQISANSTLAAYKGSHY